MSDCSSLLLGLTDIEVDLVGVGADGTRDVRVLTAPGWVGRCPQCAVVSTRSKGWVVTRPKDVKVGPDFPNLLWCKQKWLCRNGSCERKQFTESVPQIPPRARFTIRAKAEMAAAVLDGWRSVAEVSAAWGTTWNTCHRAVVAMADPVLARELGPIRVLGIDETRRGKAWVDRFDTGMVDISGDQGLLAQVNGRDVSTVVDWIQAQTPEFRAGITHVAIDMSATYAKAVRRALPHARIVVDHFHVVKLANQMIERASAAAPPKRCAAAAAARATRSGPAAADCSAAPSGSPTSNGRRCSSSSTPSTPMGISSPRGSPRNCYATCWPASTAAACAITSPRRSRSFTRSPQPARSRRSTPWPPPSTPGNNQSSPPSTPACPTPEAKATTASSNTSDGSHSGFVTATTNAAAYDGPAPAEPGPCHPGLQRYAPANSEEPLMRSVDLSGLVSGGSMVERCA